MSEREAEAVVKPGLANRRRLHGVSTAPGAAVGWAAEGLWRIVTLINWSNRRVMIGKVGLVVVGLLLASTAYATGILIPFYLYPTQTQVDKVVSLASSCPGVPIIVVINPDNGPGASFNQDYLNAVARLQSAGVVVLGYVYTSYGARNASEVKADVDKYYDWYGVDGIFLDEVWNYEDKLQYYSDLAGYVWGKGLQWVVGNPGTDAAVGYIQLFNVTVIHEDSKYPTAAKLDAYSSYKDKIAVLVYGQRRFSTSAFTATAARSGWVYVTHDTLPNPWDTLSKYLYNMAKLLGC